MLLSVDETSHHFYKICICLSCTILIIDLFDTKIVSFFDSVLFYHISRCWKQFWEAFNENLDIGRILATHEADLKWKNKKIHRFFLTVKDVILIGRRPQSEPILTVRRTKIILIDSLNRQFNCFGRLRCYGNLIGKLEAQEGSDRDVVNYYA